jgi:hypothetical protein
MNDMPFGGETRLTASARMPQHDEHTARQSGTARGAYRLGMMLCLGMTLLLPVACQSPEGGMRTADQRAVERQQREAQAQQAAAERARALAEVAELRRELESEQARAEALAQRLANIEEHIEAHKDVNITELAANVETLGQDLKQLKGDFVGLDYRTSQRFQDVALIQANLEQADEDLRKHVAMSVTNLERRGTKERSDLAADFTQKLDDERSAFMSTVRELERQTSDDRSRAALAMTAVRDALASEQTAVALHAEKLSTAIDALDAQFGTEGDAAQAQAAAEAFGNARRLHQEYLDQRHRPELLAEAIEAYGRGLAIQPGAIEMHYELARLLRMARRAEDAKPHLEYYLEHGNDPERIAQARSWLGE